MINIMKYRLLYFLISGMFLIPGIVFLGMFGLKPAVDFTGGSLLEVGISASAQPTTEEIRSVIEENETTVLEVESVQTSGENRFLIRGTTVNNDQKNQVLTVLNDAFLAVEEVRFETVGPVLGRELLVKTLVAVVVVVSFITLYVWYRFQELKYGVSAVLAVLHDTLILLGAFSALGYFLGVEVDVLFVTAVLTTLSFSVHDTIVVFDRIREKRAQFPRQDLQTIVNAAVVETLGRSINNSLTIIIMLLALTLLGGVTIRWFALALLLGAITGTYSSTFTAAPLLLVWENWKNKPRS